MILISDETKIQQTKKNDALIYRSVFKPHLRDCGFFCLQFHCIATIVRYKEKKLQKRKKQYEAS